MARPASPPIISAIELHRRLGDRRLRIADVRWYLGQAGRGREEHRRGHLPGAVFVDLEDDLSAPHGPGRHPLPDPVDFAGRLGALGFGSDHAIVAYDDASGIVAARLWWMLDRLGHPDVAVLDGGLTAWVEAGGELTSEEPQLTSATLGLGDRWPGVVGREGLVPRLGSVVLVDLRAGERYRGEVEPIDRVPGHIPTARNLPAAALLGADGRLRRPTELEALLAEATGHGTAGAETVMSCGSGVTACFGALATRVAGLPDPLLYPGSYSDWSSADMPIATGSEPGAYRQSTPHGA